MTYRRTRLAAALIALAGLTSGLVLALGAAPAQARWSNVGGITHFTVCKQAPASGRGWVFLTRTSKRAQLEDARVSLTLRYGGQQRDSWRSGWLGDRQVQRGWVRSHRYRVKLYVVQEGGDRSSGLGTSRSLQRLGAKQIHRC